MDKIFNGVFISVTSFIVLILFHFYGLHTYTSTLPSFMKYFFVLPFLWIVAYLLPGKISQLFPTSEVWFLF